MSPLHVPNNADKEVVSQSKVMSDMKSGGVSVALARNNTYFALSPESHLKALAAQMKLIRLTRTAQAAPRRRLPEGFIFPIDCLVALSGGIEEEGASTLIRFVGSNDFFRIDLLADVGLSRVIRTGHAILIEKDVWMNFGAQFPKFFESMAEFVHGRNALAIVNATCYSNHRYAKRLARLLLEARVALSAKEEWLPLSQFDIAQLMNTRRATVAVELMALAAENLIETKRGKIRIMNGNTLRDRACVCLGKTEQLAEYQLSITQAMFLGRRYVVG